MTPVIPISIREHAARSHRVAQGDKLRIGVKDEAINTDGVTVEHVRDGIALTAKGAMLLQQFRERAS